MAEILSLRDQLLKAGLVTKEQAEQANQKKPSHIGKAGFTKQKPKAAPRQVRKTHTPTREPSDRNSFTVNEISLSGLNVRHRKDLPANVRHAKRKSGKKSGLYWKASCKTARMQKYVTTLLWATISNTCT